MVLEREWRQENGRRAEAIRVIRVIRESYLCIRAWVVSKENAAAPRHMQLNSRVSGGGLACTYHATALGCVLQTIHAAALARVRMVTEI